MALPIKKNIHKKENNDKYKIPKTEFDKDGRPICAIPELQTSTLTTEMLKYLPKTGRAIVKIKKED